jgi:hypothetical protein
MKKIMLFFVPLLLVVLFTCSALIQKIDVEKEKKAILSLIKEQSAAYYASDTAKWNSIFVQDSTFTSTSASKNGYRIVNGFAPYAAAGNVQMKRPFVREEWKLIKMKIYGETAWIVIQSNGFNDAGINFERQLVTAFLEKTNGLWRIAYRNVISPLTYQQHDYFIIAHLANAKSLGKNAEETGAFTGEMLKPLWNKSGGYPMFVRTTVTNWRTMCAPEDFKVVEQDENHYIFTVTNTLPALKKAGMINNVTYDDYLTYYRIIYEKGADYIGAVYKQETIPDGLKITLTKK